MSRFRKNVTTTVVPPAPKKPTVIAPPPSASAPPPVVATPPALMPSTRPADAENDTFDAGRQAAINAFKQLIAEQAIYGDQLPDPMMQQGARRVIAALKLKLQTL